MRLICPTCGGKLDLQSLSDLDVVAYCSICGTARDMELKLFLDEIKMRPDNRRMGRNVKWLASDDGLKWLKDMVNEHRTYEEISSLLGVSRQTLYRWSKTNEDISKILKEGYGDAEGMDE